jgi:hypothetical protein
MQAEYTRTPANAIDSSVKALALASIGSAFELSLTTSHMPCSAG